MPRVNNLPKSASKIRNIGMPKMAYRMVMARPVVVVGEMWPYPAAQRSQVRGQRLGPLMAGQGAEGHREVREVAGN
jgi:hypothetical protein